MRVPSIISEHELVYTLRWVSCLIVLLLNCVEMGVLLNCCLIVEVGVLLNCP